MVIEPIVAPVSDDLTLGPGDTFEVRVFGEPDLSGAYRLSEDGTIDYPLIGQIDLKGMDPHHAAEEIAKRLAEKYLRHPNVSILVRDQTSKKIIVGGQVQKPGAYPFVPNMTVLEAIAVAGGFTPIAAKTRVRLARNEQGQNAMRQLDIPAISEGRAQNVSLRPGDVVSVPERLF